MNFKVIPMSQLGRANFDEWPVWSEYYEPDELEDIAAWGLEPSAFLAQLGELNLGDEHAVYPALQYDPLPERMRLYIKARFTTARGDVLDGYVINDDAYGAALFLDGEKYLINIYLPEFARTTLLELANQLGTSLDEMTPLRYHTCCRNRHGDGVAGTLRLP